MASGRRVFFHHPAAAHRVPNMSRYKGRTSLKVLAREFPYTVETAVPEGGLGRTLDRMYEFHSLHGIKAQAGAGRRVDDCDIVTWLFADPQVAEEFATEFNGTMLLPSTIL